MMSFYLEFLLDCKDSDAFQNCTFGYLIMSFSFAYYFQILVKSLFVELGFFDDPRISISSCVWVMNLLLCEDLEDPEHGFTFVSCFSPSSS